MDMEAISIIVPIFSKSFMSSILSSPEQANNVFVQCVPLQDIKGSSPFSTNPDTHM